MPPYWKRYWYRPYRNRWFRRRRTGKTIRRRRRRKRHWVRKPIKLIQWQPPFVKKCKIEGKTCLILFNPKRYGYNSTMYEESICPDHWPSGGGFSVSKYTLCALYDMHQKCRNWWTGSNLDLPLCKYRGVRLKFYQTEYTDYCIRIQTQLPATSNKLTYPSCQPSMMMMCTDTIKIPCRKTQKRRKPYKTVFVPPPPQLENKWYFQADMYNTPLLTIHAAATSLQNYFQKPDNDNGCVTFNILNTQFIQNRNMGIETTEPWYAKKSGTLNFYLYYEISGSDPNQPGNILLKNLIPLANPRKFTPGHAWGDTNFNKPSYEQYWNSYPNYWGNPFHPEYRQQEHSDYIYYTYISPTTIQNFMKTKTNENKKWSELTPNTNNYALTPLQDPLFYKIQYNPNKDTGIDNQFYLLSNKVGDGWDPPTNDKIVLTGFPLWLGLFGYLDFQNKLKVLTNIDTNCILVIKTHSTYPLQNVPIVIINQYYIDGKSPYNQNVLPADETKWFPQVQYQTMEMNSIIATGPGIPYLPETVSENIIMLYKFYWKWGGSPPKTVTIDNPSHQITYPIPSSEHDTTSLQSPATAPESLLYSFDQRHGLITSTALDRITKDWRTQNLIASITDSERRNQLQQAFCALEATEEEEHQKKAEILQQLNNLQHQQQCLRKQIITIMAAQRT
nr:MAG: ORF1 [TTV-like mini virus]